MSLYFKIILVIFGLAYLASPLDIIPDLLIPYIGWIDDGVVIAGIIYMIRTGKLPDFVFKKEKKKQQPHQGRTDSTRAGAKKNPFTEEKKQPGKKSPYEILGVHPTASRKQIHTAYKAAIKKYHPDKLSHLGEEFSNLANEKFLEIQNAYEALIKKAGRE